ncbi:MAG TPA: hypothetical protein VGQ35_15095, partial [Dongiaceae bacterium]|nr:hypothetical protein [Dongiaceae bacterium]
MKSLSGQAEEREKAGAASLRRQAGFDAEPPQAGFGRRKTPIPETTDGMAPRAVANDRAANDSGMRGADVEIEL